MKEQHVIRDQLLNSYKTRVLWWARAAVCLFLERSIEAQRIVFHYLFITTTSLNQCSLPLTALAACGGAAANEAGEKHKPEEVSRAQPQTQLWQPDLSHCLTSCRTPSASNPPTGHRQGQMSPLHQRTFYVLKTFMISSPTINPTLSHVPKHHIHISVSGGLFNTSRVGDWTISLSSLCHCLASLSRWWNVSKYPI